MQTNTASGIWADDSDEDERPAFGRAAGKTKGKNYTAPMNFVSGGVKVGDKVILLSNSAL